MQGENRVTKSVLRMIGQEKLTELDLYVSELLDREFSSLKDLVELEFIVNDFIASLNEEELLVLRSYTGYNFKCINAIIRNNWNYEEHGLLNDEIKLKYLELVRKLKEVVNKFPALDVDFCTYRGVELDVFKKFEITKIADLIHLKGKYMYEEGFTSTSINSESSYFNKTLENGKTYNVGIKYLIPRESKDGILLSSSDLSYSPNQNEYLLNSGSLVKVLDVSVDSERNLAELVVMLVPKRLWDLENNREIPGR